jgi:hypothetical protein
MDAVAEDEDSSVEDESPELEPVHVTRDQD